MPSRELSNANDHEPRTTTIPNKTTLLTSPLGGIRLFPSRHSIYWQYNRLPTRHQTCGMPPVSRPEWGSFPHYLCGIRPSSSPPDGPLPGRKISGWSKIQATPFRKPSATRASAVRHRVPDLLPVRSADEFPPPVANWAPKGGHIGWNHPKALPMDKCEGPWQVHP